MPAYLALQLLAIAAMNAVSAVLVLASFDHDSVERRPTILRHLPNELEPDR